MIVHFEAHCHEVWSNKVIKKDIL